MSRLLNTTGFLKNHWTKHRLVCTHFDAFSMLIPNMHTIFINFEIFFGTKIDKNESVVCCICEES